MNILIDHQIFLAQKFGGISRYFNELSNTNEVNVSRISPELFKDSEVISTDFLSRGTRFIKRKVGIVQNKVTPIPSEVIAKLSDNNFDIFHPTYYDPYFLEYVSKPFVITVYDMIHEIYKEYFPLNDRVSNNKLLLCNKASHIIAISETTKQDLINIFNIPKEKISVTLLASDFANIKPADYSLFDSEKKTILFVGSRQIYKNFFYPLVAIADLIKNDKEIQLVCTGAPFSNDELNYFSLLGILGNIVHVFLKNDSELAWAYRNSKVFIFPSLYEGFGFPLLEAFASGCPVVTSNGGSLSEVGADAALYFNPKCILSIKEALYKAMYDMDERNQLIQKGYMRLQDFSWEKCRRETLDVYKKVLD